MGSCTLELVIGIVSSIEPSTAYLGNCSTAFARMHTHHHRQTYGQLHKILYVLAVEKWGWYTTRLSINIDWYWLIVFNKQSLF